MSVQAKASIACVVCRTKKVKCSGTFPCTYCLKRRLECSPPKKAQKRLYSVEHIENLQNRLSQYENARLPSSSSPPEYDARQFSTSDNRAFPDGEESRCHLSPTPLGERGSTLASNDHEPLNELSSAPSGTLSRLTKPENNHTLTPAAITADASMSSSHIFGARVHDLLRQSPVYSAANPQSPTPVSTTIPAAAQDLIQSWHNAQSLLLATPNLPSREHALQLLHSVDFYIGRTQQHFDVREVSDHIDILFDGDLSLSPTPKLWYLKIILVFAIGKLYEGEFGDESFPGEGHFKYAQDLLPSLSELYASKRHGVEVLSLMAIYLQSANRREEAYLYINSALRIAVAHGFHRSNSMKGYIRSERAHLNRLWWTIYMQEKRLAAATGNPSSVNHDSIELDMPADAFGFPPAFPICLNIRTAHITGRILHSRKLYLPVIFRPHLLTIAALYGQKPQFGSEFIQSVLSVIQELHEISEEISAELPLDFKHGTQSRTSKLSMRAASTLHVMLYQAIMLTIRPIMLHAARLILTGDETIRPSLCSSSLGRLSRICTEAARKLLDITLLLKREKSIPIFGFFDIDATFSAAFVMILTAILSMACEKNGVLVPSPGLGEAVEILRYLSDGGNLSAAERVSEIEHIWTRLHLGPTDNRPGAIPTSDSGYSSARPSSDSQGVPALSERAEKVQQQQRYPTPNCGQPSMGVSRQAPVSHNQYSSSSHPSRDDVGALPTWTHQDVVNGDGSSVHEFLLGDLLVDDTNEQYHALLNNAQCALTGQDSIDFAELEKWLPGLGE